MHSPTPRNPLLALLASLALSLTACGGGGGGGDEPPPAPQLQLLEINSTPDRDGFVQNTAFGALPDWAGGVIRVGEVDESVVAYANSSNQGFVSFDIAGVRNLRVLKATLRLTQRRTLGQPWQEFARSGMLVQHLNLDHPVRGLSADDFGNHTSTPGAIAARYQSVADGETIELDVTRALMRQLGSLNTGGQAVLDLRLVMPDSGGGGATPVTDLVDFYGGESQSPPQLVIEYE